MYLTHLNHRWEGEWEWSLLDLITFNLPHVGKGHSDKVKPKAIAKFILWMTGLPLLFQKLWGNVVADGEWCLQALKKFKMTFYLMLWNRLCLWLRGCKYCSLPLVLGYFLLFGEWCKVTAKPQIFPMSCVTRVGCRDGFPAVWQWDIVKESVSNRPNCPLLLISGGKAQADTGF